MKRLRFVIGLLFIVAAAALWIAHGAKRNMVYTVTVSELLAQERLPERNGLRVSGKVVPGTIQRQDMRLRFQMTDGEKAVPVNYRGVVPDTFRDEGEVTVEGQYNPDGTFQANFLMAKCPSKYEAMPGENGQPPKHPDEVPMKPS